MKISFYGHLAELVGREIEIAVPPAAVTVGEMRSLLARLYPHAAGELASLSLRACVDDRMVAEDFPVAGAGTVAFFPPLSGG